MLSDRLLRKFVLCSFNKLVLNMEVIKHKSIKQVPYINLSINSICKTRFESMQGESRTKIISLCVLFSVVVLSDLEQLGLM